MGRGHGGREDGPREQKAHGRRREEKPARAGEIGADGRLEDEEKKRHFHAHISIVNLIDLESVTTKGDGKANFLVLILTRIGVDYSSTVRLMCACMPLIPDAYYMYCMYYMYLGKARRGRDHALVLGARGPGVRFGRKRRRSHQRKRIGKGMGG